MHNNRNKKHVREGDVMLPALAHEKHHAMGVQLLVDLIDLKRAGRSADCSAQTSDSRRTSFIVYSFRVHISWPAPRAAERAAKHRSNSAKTRTCRVCFSNKPASGCSALQASSSSPSDGRPLPDARDAAAAAAATPPRCTARSGREQISRRQALVLLRTCAVCHSRVSTRSVWW